jgi:DNA/RNA-binding protein KIN17
MGKHEKGSVKDIAKQIKSKGLQKLKFFCQLCEKQCRDANGFKCHLTSDSHLRQVKLFSGNAQGVMDRYSKEFEKMFLDNLRMRHQTVKVSANNVYQQVIQDKQHVHMNATIWATLTDFCKYLGKCGKCLVEETERGWMIQYIDRDPSKAAKSLELQKRTEAEQAAEMALHEKFQRQREEAAKLLDPSALEELLPSALDSNVNVSLEIRPLKKTKIGKVRKIGSVFGDDDDDENSQDEGETPPPGPPLPPILLENSKKRPRAEAEASQTIPPVVPNESWLLNNIIVRIIDKKSKYFKQKAAVKRAARLAQVTLLQDPSTHLEVKQKHLETVVPKTTGICVRLLQGTHRGQVATVNSLDKREFRATLQLANGTVLHGVDYNDFSQQAE